MCVVCVTMQENNEDVHHIQTLWTNQVKQAFNSNKGKGKERRSWLNKQQTLAEVTTTCFCLARSRRSKECVQCTQAFCLNEARRTTNYKLAAKTDVTHSHEHALTWQGVRIYRVTKRRNACLCGTWCANIEPITLFWECASRRGRIGEWSNLACKWLRAWWVLRKKN